MNEIQNSNNLNPDKYQKKLLLSIIIPCYNEEEVLPIFIETIKPVCEELCSRENSPCDTELIFIDDGSSDNTLPYLRNCRNNDKRIRYVSFSKNFGKEAAILAGLKEAKGNYSVLIDADLQHPPTLIPKMYDELINGNYDSVAMFRDERKKEGFFRRHFSSFFYKILNRLSKLNLKNGATDFRIMTKQMVSAVISLPESNRFSKGIFNWIGFNTKWLAFETGKRPAGKSKWSSGKLVSYSFDAILSFSEVPLKLCSWMGILFCILSFVLGIYHLVKTLLFGDPVAGFPTLYLMMLLMGGIMLLFLGIIGQYLARIYLEIKKRPAYIIKETETNTDDNDIS